jgi:hypothetical protein
MSQPIGPKYWAAVKNLSGETVTTSFPQEPKIGDKVTINDQEWTVISLEVPAE